jgi:hypothetical protein
MVKRLKIFISGFTGILLIIITLISFGLWTMEIEDRYGDLQEVYYKSQDGDLILLENKQNGLNKYGLIDKSWNRIFVHSHSHTTKQDLNQWVNTNPMYIKLLVYKNRNKSIQHLLLEKPEKINQLISTDEFELIIKLE